MHYHLKLQSIQRMCKQLPSHKQVCFLGASHIDIVNVYFLGQPFVHTEDLLQKTDFVLTTKAMSTCNMSCMFLCIWYILGLFTILIIQHGHGTTNRALPKIGQTTSAFPAKLLQRVVLYLGNHHLGIGKASTRCISNRVCWKVYRKTWGKLTFAEHGLIKQIQKGE